MSTITYCASGCTVRGAHLDPCRTVCSHKARGASCPKGCDGTCRGCQPRMAEFGQLCPFCWQRLNADVVDSPALARYLWAVGHSGETEHGDGASVRSGDPAERGILHGAIDALDGLHACLASWAHLILEEHPDGEHMAGPDQRGVRVTATTKRFDDTVFPREDGEPEVWIRSAQVSGVRDPEATSRLVRWLLPQLAWCARQEWAGEMRREIGDVVRTTAARYPVAERTRSIPGVGCPVCGRVSLVYDPATTERHTIQVNCSTRGCGVIYTEDEFKRLARIVEWEHEQERTA